MPESTDDRILPFTWWLSLAIIPFLIAASVLLYLLPTHTDVHFAWTIEPPITAMFLASAYVGGIWFFAQVVSRRSWHRVRYGFPAVIVFASLLCAATFLHWDRFHFGHVSFVTWLTLYCLTPALVLIATIVNWRRASTQPEMGDAVIPIAVRLVLALVGAAAFVTGIVLFVLPQLLVGVWAWDVTPLTARVVGAILTLPGCVNIWMLADARWTSFRWVFQAQIVSLLFIAGCLVVRSQDMQWARPSAWLFTGGIVVSLVIYIGFYAVTTRSASRQGWSPQPSSRRLDG